jgi:capsid assembly protease
MKYAHIINFIRNTPLAIMKSKMVDIQQFLYAKSLDLPIAADLEARHEAKAKPRATQKGSVAVMDVYGIFTQRTTQADVSAGGLFSCESFSKAFAKVVADPSVKAIVLNIDSPGGSVFGVQELADEIYKARETKHIVAVSNSLCASAAYWIAAQCDRVVVTPGGQIGSIGVFTVHEDWSKAYEDAGVIPTIIEAGKYKTEGTYLKPLTEEGLEAIQDDVNFYYDQFTKAVARGRGVKQADVRKGFGEGRVVNSKGAIDSGIADEINTLDGVLESLGASSGTQQPLGKNSSVATAHKKLDLVNL